jgi:hypothetical protein
VGVGRASSTICVIPVLSNCTVKPKKLIAVNAVNPRVYSFRWFSELGLFYIIKIRKIVELDLILKIMRKL